MMVPLDFELNFEEIKQRGHNLRDDSIKSSKKQNRRDQEEEHKLESFQKGKKITDNKNNVPPVF